MSGTFETSHLMTFDPGWYAETASGFAGRSLHDTRAASVGAGVAMIGPGFQESVRGSMLDIDAAEHLARDWWGSQYPAHNPDWVDRVSGLMLLELVADSAPDGWYDIGYFTVNTGSARCGGWLQMLGGDVYSWSHVGPTITWLPRHAANLTDDQAAVVDDLFPPGLAF
jgi:hypothetical protein